MNRCKNCGKIIKVSNLDFCSHECMLKMKYHTNIESSEYLMKKYYIPSKYGILDSTAYKYMNYVRSLKNGEKKLTYDEWLIRNGVKPEKTESFMEYAKKHPNNTEKELKENV